MGGALAEGAREVVVDLGLLPVDQQLQHIGPGHGVLGEQVLRVGGLGPAPDLPSVGYPEEKKKRTELHDFLTMAVAGHSRIPSR